MSASTPTPVANPRIRALPDVAKRRHTTSSNPFDVRVGRRAPNIVFRLDGEPLGSIMRRRKAISMADFLQNPWAWFGVITVAALGIYFRDTIVGVFKVRLAVTG